MRFNFLKKPLPIGDNGTENIYAVQSFGPPSSSYLGWGGILVQGSLRSSEPGTYLTAKQAFDTNVYSGYELNGSADLLPLVNPNGNGNN